MTSMILINQRPGFIVENEEMPPSHPQHPSQKGSVLLKVLKGTMKRKMPKRRLTGSHGGKIVLSSDIRTTKGKP